MRGEVISVLSLERRYHILSRVSIHIDTVLIQTSNQFECLDPIYDMTSPQTKIVKYENNVFIA